MVLQTFRERLVISLVEISRLIPVIILIVPYGFNVSLLSLQNSVCRR